MEYSVFISMCMYKRGYREPDIVSTNHSVEKIPEAACNISDQKVPLAITAVSKKLANTC